MKSWLTWINLGADKLQHNISCSYPIIDGIQMLQDSLFEILFDFIPHCHHRSHFELYLFLCMHCARNRGHKPCFKDKENLLTLKYTTEILLCVFISLNEYLYMISWLSDSEKKEKS